MTNTHITFPAYGLTKENREQYLKSLAYLLGMYLNGEYRTTELKAAGVDLFKGVEFNLQWIIDDLARREEAGEINSMQAAMQLEEFQNLENSLGVNETFLMRHINLNLDRIPESEVKSVPLAKFPKALYIKRMKEVIIALREGLGLIFVDNSHDPEMMAPEAVEAEVLLKASLSPDDKNSAIQDTLKSIRVVEALRAEIKLANEEDRGWEEGKLPAEAEEELRIYCCSFIDQLVNAFLKLKEDQNSTAVISLVDHTTRPLPGVESHLQVLYGRCAEHPAIKAITLDFEIRDGSKTVYANVITDSYPATRDLNPLRFDLVPAVGALIVALLAKEAGVTVVDQCDDEDLLTFPVNLLPSVFDYDPAWFAEALIAHSSQIEETQGA